MDLVIKILSVLVLLFLMGAMLFAVIRKLIGDPCCFFLMTSTNCKIGRAHV